MSEETPNVTVLLVDDEENILRSLQRLLMDEELTVETALSGEAALELLPTLSNVGLIISDQRMPGINGAEFLGRSRDFAPQAVRILLTGYSDITATIEAINRGGASRYIAKPWNDDELILAVREAVRHYGLVMENIRLNEIIVSQNKELQEWNKNLRDRVLQQTTAIRKKSEEVQAALEQVNSDFQGMITALSTLVEMRGNEVRDHARKVAELAVNAAREMGIEGTGLENIRIAALLHDIGEIGIPERILAQPPETMDIKDFDRYRLHPVRSQMALVNITALHDVGSIIRHHHENHDGSGFPDRLSSDDIPVGSRIIAFADQFERISRTVGGDIADSVLSRMELGVGTKYDPLIFKVFRKTAKYSYFNKYTGISGNDIEVEMRPEQLAAGMTLSRNLISGSGMLLLYRGIPLEKEMIRAINSYYELDPPEKGVFVFTKR